MPDLVITDLVPAAFAALAVVGRPSWAVLRHLVTMAHEGGHAAVAVAAGRRLQGVRLHSDTSGLTVSAGRATGAGVVFTLLSGYLAPSALGLLAAAALAHEHVEPTLWAALALLGLLLTQIRNAFGVLAVLVAGAALFGLSWWSPPPWQAAAANLLAWFLLLAAPRPVVELQRSRRRHRAPDSDADQLARLTGVPALLWVGLFLLTTLAAAVLGGWWLIPA